MVDNPSHFPHAHTDKKASRSESLIDYEQFRSDGLEPLGSLWDVSEPLSGRLMNLLNEAVILPHKNIQLPIIVAYSLIPSALATIAPILFLQGAKGSGKSTVTILISELHQSTVMSAATTFAGLRNYFNELRWDDPTECDGERNTCLLFDNVNKETLSNENLYTFLLNGYNRKTDSISISKGNGENFNFKAFGLKVMSSIHPFYASAQFAELNRRCIVIKCKPFEAMQKKERDSLGLPEDFTINERLELEAYDLTPLHTAFSEFWSDSRNLGDYVILKRRLMTRRKGFKIPETIDGAKWTISVDLLVTGIVTRVWDSIEEGLSHLGQYWGWYADHVASAHGAIHRVLMDFIKEELKQTEQVNKALGYEAIPPELSPERVKKCLSQAAALGMLDVVPTPSVTASTMADIGWMLGKNTSEKMAWIRSLT